MDEKSEKPTHVLSLDNSDEVDAKEHPEPGIDFILTPLWQCSEDGNLFCSIPLEALPELISFLQFMLDNKKEVTVTVYPDEYDAFNWNDEAS